MTWTSWWPASGMIVSWLFWQESVFILLCRLFPAKPRKQELRKWLCVLAAALYAVNQFNEIPILYWSILFSITWFKYAGMAWLSQCTWTKLAACTFTAKMANTVCFYLLACLCPEIYVYSFEEPLYPLLDMVTNLWSLYLLQYILPLVYLPVDRNRGAILRFLLLGTVFVFAYSILSGLEQSFSFYKRTGLTWNLVFWFCFVLVFLFCLFAWLIKTVWHKGRSYSQVQLDKWDASLNEQEANCLDAENRLAKLRHDQINLLDAAAWLVQEKQNADALAMVKDMIAREQGGTIDRNAAELTGSAESGHGKIETG